MIKILKHGHIMKIECKNCGALLSYEYEDIKEDKYNKLALDGMSGWKRYIICPQCNAEIITEASR